ncbi:hypothetical protein RJT34_24738 [Clitoria ternatea]|uniref:Uncharacterized protein n=1 Tax=Clitoria ternatea TaxID=43366 RepID=A0AAN9FR82_CLITE
MLRNLSLRGSVYKLMIDDFAPQLQANVDLTKLVVEASSGKLMGELRRPLLLILVIAPQLREQTNRPQVWGNDVCEIIITVAERKPTMATNESNRVGLVLSNTDSIRAFLSVASKDPILSDELRQTSSELLLQSDVPYAPLRALWVASHPSTRPELNRLLSGTQFLFSSPKPRLKSEELKARLKKLEDLAERKAYQELVKDIAPKNDVHEPFSSYKDQLGFGLHLVVTMFTGYLLGYAAFRALFNHSTAMNAAGGILGLVGAMLVETFLFIIRSSNADANKTRMSNQKPRSSFSTSSLKKNQ